MKSISFQDSEGLNLTQAVLDGYKTMTRQVVSEQVEKDIEKHVTWLFRTSCKHAYIRKLMENESICIRYIREHSPYNVGEVVSIQGTPHHIRITDVRVERLQDISDEDCMREGITKVQPIAKDNSVRLCPFYMIKSQPNICSLFVKEVFAKLTDAVYGRGTWDRNPLVWAYSFQSVN